MAIFQQNKTFGDNIENPATVVLGRMPCTIVVYCSFRRLGCTKRVKNWSFGSLLKEYRQHWYCWNFGFGISRGRAKEIWSEVPEMIIGPSYCMGTSIWGPRMGKYNDTFPYKHFRDLERNLTKNGVFFFLVWANHRPSL